MKQFFPYPKIENFQNFIKTYKAKQAFIGLTENNEPIFEKALLENVNLVGTVKLHGTNAGVTVFPDGEIYIQKRSAAMKLSIVNGPAHFGFMQFVFDNQQWFLKAYEDVKKLSEVENPIITFFGEWAGPGIQKGVGISQIPDKKFFIFGVQEQTTGKWIPLSTIPYNTFNERIWYINMFQKFYVDANMNDAAGLLEQLNTITLEVEKECPVAKEFGISGIGEGIVWTGYDSNNNFIRFKVKGDKHQKKSNAPKVKNSTEKIDNPGIKEFIDQIDITGRLQQCYHSLYENEVPSKAETGKVLNWVFNDIVTEEYHLMKELDINVSDLKPHLMVAIRLIFFNDINESL